MGLSYRRVGATSTIVGVCLLVLGVPAHGQRSRAVVRDVKAAVAHVDREEWSEALALLEPLRTDEDSLIQSAVHFSLGKAYQGRERSLDATEAYLRVIEMEATPPAQRTKAEEALAEIYTDPTRYFRTPDADHGVARLTALGERLGREAPIRGWLLYTLADAFEAGGRLRQALSGFEYLGDVFSESRPGLASQARERAAELRRQYFAGLAVPCKPDERGIYFSVQNLSVDNAPIHSQRCSTEPVVIEPGRHGVLIWRQHRKKDTDPPPTLHRMIDLPAGEELELDYLLEYTPDARSFSPVTASIGGGLVATAVVAHFISAGTTDDDPKEALFSTAIAAYAAGGALLLGEFIRLGMDGFGD